MGCSSSDPEGGQGLPVEGNMQPPGTSPPANMNGVQPTTPTTPSTPTTPTPTNPGVGAAGTAANPPVGTDPPKDPMMVDPMMVDPMMPDEHSILSDECGLDTGWPGDEYCILPPPPDQGFQVHIGPEDYDNVDPRYILAGNDEITNNFSDTSPNTEQKYFYFRKYRMRPGSHHMIATETGSGGGGGITDIGGRRIGTANLSQDSPAGGKISPENKGVGMSIGPRANINVSLHSINVTPEPILREVWINFYYRPTEEVTEPAISLFKSGDPTFSVAPGADQILGPYSCDIQGSGRLLWFYGHRHANNVRFSAWRVRGAQRDLFYEGLHWEETLLLDYSSDVKNPVPDRATGREGGWSGVLDLKPGDKLEWECHVINKQATPLRFSNETYLGEMCIMDGETVGATCNGGGGGLGF
jgi:hypothetical protein